MVDANNSLMRDFMEFEGLTDQVMESRLIDDNDDDDMDSLFRPGNAATLSSADIYYEMEKRQIKSTGFPDTDREILQKAFNEEFQRDFEEAMARRKELRRKQAQQAGVMKRRLHMESLLQEEFNELVTNHQVGLTIDYIKENILNGFLRVEVNSISARALAKAMWSNQTIVSLDLSANELNDHSGSYLARILNRNYTLERLDLNSNNFGTQTCAAFGESLLKNTTLKHLNLESNPLGLGDQAGLRKMIEALRENKTLMSLNLWRTRISSSMGSILADAIENNDTLLFLDVGKNDIDMYDMKRIVTKIEKNLKAYDLNERLRRVELQQENERNQSLKSQEEAKVKKQQISSWLEERRNQRAESRRKEEEERIANMIREAEEQRIFAEQEREEARKAAEAAAAKKAKKNKNKGKDKKK